MESKAKNFNSFVESKVDERTGLFSSQIELFSGSANQLLGPNPSIILQYDPMNSNTDYLFGKGWYMGITMIDFHKKKLILSTGESYKFKAGLSTEDDLLDRKSKTFTLKRDTDNNYEIIHQGGLKEILVHDNTDQNFYLKRQVTQGGKYVEYKWGISYQNYKYLTEITDMFGSVLLKLTYDIGKTVTVVKNPSTDFESSILIRISSGFLYMSTLSNQPYKYYVYEYDKSHKDFNLLNKITGPFGLVTEILYEYDSKGHLLPSGAGIQYFPRVKIAYSGDSSTYPLGRNTTTYGYSITNYFGYHGNSVYWDADYDHSYRQNPDYQYDTTVTDLLSGRKIKTTYNRFHLEINKCEEVVVDGKIMLIETITDHHDNKDGHSFNDQPPYFQQPKTITVQHTEKNLYDSKILRDKKEIVIYDSYDDYNNLLKFTNKDGAVTIYEYYPSTGEAGFCPPNNYNLIDKMKSTTTIPSTNSEYKDELGESVLITYTNVNAWSKNLNGKDIQVQSVKKLCEESYYVKNGNKTLITSTTNEYYNFDLSNMKSEEDKLIGGLIWKTIDQFKDIKHLTHYEYSFAEKNFTNTIIQTPYFDGTNIFNNNSTKTVSKSDSILGANTSEAIYSSYNGSEYVSITSQTLDNKQFLTTTVTTDAEGTSTTSTKQYKFEDTHGFSIVTTDKNGNIAEDVYNYMGSLTHSYIQYLGGKRLLMQENSYDNEMRLINSIKYDYIENANIFDVKGNLKVGSETISTKTALDYDFYDQVYKQINNDNNNAANITINDYITDTQIKKVGKTSQLAYNKTLFNIMQQPIEESFFRANGELIYTIYKKYDALHRLREVVLPPVLFEENTAELGRKQYVEYDDLGRVYKTTAGLIDEAGNFIENSKIVTETTFWEDSPEALLKTLTVDNVLVLEKSYDQQMRVMSSKTGNLKYLSEYNSASSPITKVTQPNNATITMEYDPSKHFIQTETIVSGDVNYKVKLSEFDAQYKPHRVESFLGDEVITTKVFEYDPATEVLNKSTISYPTKSARTMTYEYSKSKGSMVGMTDAFDKKISYTFYEDGKIKSQSYNNMTTTFEYNEYDLLDLEIISLPDGKRMEKLYAYDEFLRVSSITYQQDSKITKLVYIFDNVLGKLSSKQTFINSTLVLQEDYKYTYTDTLYSVEYSGDQTYFPQDEYNNIITKEVYIHDKLNNLLQVDTFFTTGESNTAKYTYSSAHFAQVVGITNTLTRCYPAEISLQYNDLGQVIFDGKNNITYNNLGQVASINDKKVIYDETGKIININDKYFYYNGSTLLNEDNASNDIGYASGSSYHILEDGSTENYKLYKRDVKNTNLEEE